MALSNQQLLDAVETAIQTILDGGVSSYSINGRSATNLDLQQLFNRRDALIAAVSREQYGSFGVAEFREAR